MNQLNAIFLQINKRNPRIFTSISFLVFHLYYNLSIFPRKYSNEAVMKAAELLNVALYLHVAYFTAMSAAHWTGLK